MKVMRWYAAGALAASLIFRLPIAGAAAFDVTPTYAEHPYTLATTCDAGKPPVFVNLVLRNGGDSPSAPVRLTATDSLKMLEGDTTLPPLPARAQIAVALALHRAPTSTGSLGGQHVVDVKTFVNGARAKDRLPPLQVPIPATLCAQVAAVTPTPAASTSAAPGALRKAPFAVAHRAVNVTLATPAPAPKFVGHVNTRALVLAVAAPTNTRAAVGGPDCASHVGALAALLCPDMIRSGDLLLGWDWQAGPGPADIDGYRVYRVDGGSNQLIYTQANKKDITLVDVPKPGGGYTGKCYAVTAYAGSKESALSSPFCAGGGAAAKTVRLSAVHARSSEHSGSNAGNFVTGSFHIDTYLGGGRLIVGHNYWYEKHTLGDEVQNFVERGAVAFDTSSVANRRIVAAKLHLTIDDSRGAGNNHSCITNVLTGTEFWWQNQDWLEVPAGDKGALSANSVPTDTGPEITADVTALVAPWLIGQPNYGFVLINSDEDTGAFANRVCQTTYSNPILEITYY